MWISDYAIRKPIVTTVVMIALVVFGLVALKQLDTDEFPDVEVPLVAVTVVYPGASPGTVERELVDPLEESFQSLSGVDNIQSTCVDGYAVIIVFFRFGKDIAEASQDIRDKISEKRADLPTEMEEPILSRFKAADFPIVSLVLASEQLDPVDLTELAEQKLSRELSSIPGVASVTVVGGTKREMTVAIKPHELAATGLGIPQVVQALATQSLAAPVGRLTGPYDERTIRLRGRLETSDDLDRKSVV